MWHRVVRYKASTVSEELTAYLHVEGGSRRILNFLPVCRATWPAAQKKVSLNLTGTGRGEAERMGSSDGLLCRQYVYKNVPVFPWQSRFYSFQRPVSWYTAKLGSGRQMSWVFPRHNLPETAHERLDSPHCEERSWWVKLSPPATNRKEQEREWKMCRLVVVEWWLRLRMVRNRYVYCTSVAVSLSSSSFSSTSLFHLNP